MSSKSILGAVLVIAASTAALGDAYQGDPLVSRPAREPDVMLLCRGDGVRTDRNNTLNFMVWQSESVCSQGGVRFHRCAISDVEYSLRWRDEVDDDFISTYSVNRLSGDLSRHDYFFANSKYNLYSYKCSRVTPEQKF